MISLAFEAVLSMVARLQYIAPNSEIVKIPLARHGTRTVAGDERNTETDSTLRQSIGTTARRDFVLEDVFHHDAAAINDKEVSCKL